MHDSTNISSIESAKRHQSKTPDAANTAPDQQTAHHMAYERPSSLTSSTTQDSIIDTYRRDSGYSSKPTSTRPCRQTSSRHGSRSSSKQSLPSTRDTSIEKEHVTRRPQRPRLNTMNSTMTCRKSTGKSTMSKEEAFALHERSLRLFPASPASCTQSPIISSPQPLNRSISSPHTAPSRPPTRRQHSTQTYNSLPRNRLSGLRGLNDLDLTSNPHSNSNPLSANSPQDVSPPITIPDPTTKFWTSNETRQKEYARIDRQNRGLRGLWNKVMPRFARTNTGSKFYEEDGGSDAGSVRRFRIDASETAGRA
ncbi:hypothetical protein BT63DRAFT_460208 [Microthyrium microscopicum]|uniref:Uncharacterized protein n=1 Tax=Microthyrium microscopicum TaxID=703497 RepID=A0A6A6TX91_9PEZI|nr:hypothetical protein BT63DRAFT_460208 [Microthyrium microscopicum]